MDGLPELLIDSAIAEGFAAAGVVDIAKARAELAQHSERYRSWVARGMHGAMDYLVRGSDRRADPAIVMPGAKAVLSVVIAYPRQAAGATDARQGPRYARYLQGPDYHEDISERLERAMRRATAALPAGDGLGYKICVDTSAVLERAWAALAGLGWIGKNTMLIHPKLGSYLFLGEVLIDRETGRGPAPIADLCGHCERCLKGCPTQAITSPREIDSNRCISYFTLEKRGDFDAPNEITDKIGPWVAGCDVCQEVCPFNIKPVRSELKTIPSGATRAQEWIELLEETEENYRDRIKNSALSRVKPAQFRRNLALALGVSSTKLDAKDRELYSARVEQMIARETDSVAKKYLRDCLEKLSPT